MQTFEHFCSGCDAKWFDHEWQSTCPKCGSELVTNWPTDSEASHRAIDLARVWLLDLKDKEQWELTSGSSTSELLQYGNFTTRNGLRNTLFGVLSKEALEGKRQK